MNIIRVRDVAKEMHKSHLFQQRTLIAIIQNPVFIYEGGKREFTDAEWAWCQENILSDIGKLPIHLPYKTFTLVRPSPFSDEQEAEMAKKGLPKGGDTIYFVFTGDHETKNPDGSPRKSILTVIRQDIMNGRVCWLSISMNDELKKGACLSVMLDGKPLEIDKLHDMEEMNKQMVQSTIRTITQFAFDTMSSRCVTVKVSPRNTDGKSVEWHLARTHYLVIGKKQAMVCREQKRGPTGAEIKRAAGLRKAHIRFLSSERFKHKRFQTVKVKEAWVGPKEWQGTDGKIYRVLHDESPSSGGVGKQQPKETQP